MCKCVDCLCGSLFLYLAVPAEQTVMFIMVSDCATAEPAVLLVPVLCLFDVLSFVTFSMLIG